MPSNIDRTTDSPDAAGQDLPEDRRSRKRRERRDWLLTLAADLVERDGVEGLTMAALAEAADYATASLYTYFPSRSALLAAMQRDALEVLAASAAAHLARWDAELSADDDPRTAATARLWAFADLFTAGPRLHPREFRLQQQLLVSVAAEDPADAAAVVPAAMAVLEVPRRLLAQAAEAGALDDGGGPVTDTVGDPLDTALLRTFAWLVAMNGALLLDGLKVGAPATGAEIGAQLTGALLRGWGAPPELVAAGRARSAGWVG